jgi:hypothetical protein
MQGAQILRNEAYLLYVAMTKDEAQRRRWTFYEAVKFHDYTIRYYTMRDAHCHLQAG